MRVLVVNVGSSSVKLRLLDADDSVLLRWDQPAADPAGAVRQALAECDPPDAVGHRFVHGGPELRSAAIVDDATLVTLRAVTELAPLHNPPALAALDAARAAAPSVPNVACFDTAFHARLPEAAARYALPREWTERYGLRRYGFHGLSFAYATRRAAQMLGRDPSDLRLVICHLGAGASAAAVAGGRSVDTTMGFTPLEGLVMATRSGSVDPGLLLWLQRRHGVAAGALEEALERRSGLMGMTGTGDMREVVAAAGRGEEPHSTALAVYVHRLRAAIASLAAAMGGLDVLVFTGAVGEGSDRVRTATCDGLVFLGVAAGSSAGEAPLAEDTDLTAEGARVRTLVIHAREDLEIAAETRAAMAAAGPR
ncbi:MAG: acetate kinase [Gaiellales bacterium]|nr:acetate kinase [Gaiellales bacterium]